MIASINDGMSEPRAPPPPSRRSTRTTATARPAAREQLAAVDVMRNINSLSTAATLIIEDATPNKVDSLNVLAAQSIAARKLLAPLQSNAPVVKLNRLEAMDVLELLTNVYDNVFEVITTTE